MGQGQSSDKSEVVSLVPNASFESEGMVVTTRECHVDILRLHRVRLPVLGEREVRVSMRAAAVNPSDLRRMRTRGGVTGEALVGTPSNSAVSRDVPHSLPSLPLPYIAGTDGAGFIEAVGSEAFCSTLGLQVGDGVCFQLSMTEPCGSFARHANVSAEAVCKIPTTPVSGRSTPVTMLEAAGMPTASWAAYVAIFDKLRVEPQRTIFINGGSGGVGSTAIQMAKYAGCYVIAACSPHNVAFVKSLGADSVLDYTSQDIVESLLAITSGYGVDYILEAVNSNLGAKHAAALRFGGSLCLLCGPCSAPVEYLFTRQISVHHVYLAGLHLSPMTVPLLSQVGKSVMQLFVTGAFHLHIEKVPFGQAAAAIQQAASGHTRGKLVVDIASLPQCEAAPPREEG